MAEKVRNPHETGIIYVQRWRHREFYAMWNRRMQTTNIVGNKWCLIREKTQNGFKISENKEWHFGKEVYLKSEKRVWEETRGNGDILK